MQSEKYSWSRGSCKIFATNNNGKLKEVRENLSDHEILSLKDANVNVEVDENHNTFYENALEKTKEIYKITRLPAIADDSGLIFDALGDWSGVLTRRFLGEDATDEERNNALLARADEFHDCSATVACVLVYYDGENILEGIGNIHGRISTETRGENVFGSEPIFWVAKWTHIS